MLTYEGKVCYCWSTTLSRILQFCRYCSRRRVRQRLVQQGSKDTAGTDILRSVEWENFRTGSKQPAHSKPRTRIRLPHRTKRRSETAWGRGKRDACWKSLRTPRPPVAATFPFSSLLFFYSLRSAKLGLVSQVFRCRCVTLCPHKEPKDKYNVNRQNGNSK